jgi:hypothetical protein
MTDKDQFELFDGEIPNFPVPVLAEPHAACGLIPVQPVAVKPRPIADAPGSGEARESTTNKAEKSFAESDSRGGETLRDKGIQKVASNNENWLESCIEAATTYVRSKPDFTGEDIRFHCESMIGGPRHPNGWGALINALIKRKVIRANGEYRIPRDKTSHARKVQVYRDYEPEQVYGSHHDIREHIRLGGTREDY